jgi:hypothetical protein
VFLDKNKFKNIFLFKKNHYLDFPTIVMVVKIKAIKDALFAIFSAKIVACPLKKKVRWHESWLKGPLHMGFLKRPRLFGSSRLGPSN